MKNFRKFLLTLVIGALLAPVAINAQDEEEKSSPFTVGVDLVSTYVWRGTAYSGPSLQPAVDFTVGGFSIGAWGSQGFDGFQEMDLYAGYGFDFGLYLGLTDYYYPGTQWFDYSDTSGAHAFEINAGFEVGGLSLAANYIVNEAGGAGSTGNDMYFEVGYSFSIVDIFLGAGDGWHTTDGEFAVCNAGLGVSKDVKITDSYSLPVFGQVVFNPQSEQFMIVAGFSF